MTKFQFASDLLNIINTLLETGVSGCTNHETRCYLDELFDKYEEYEGTTCHANNGRGDLELYTHIVDSLHQRGYDLWKENKEQKAKTKKPNEPFCTEQFFKGLNDMINVPFGQYESECDQEEQEVKMQNILDDIAFKEKNMPKELKGYFHTIENLDHDNSYIIWLDGLEDHGDLTCLPSDISIMTFESECDFSAEF